MKKRTYIAAAMAFVALVGCQKDLLQSASVDKADDVNLDQRPVVGNVTLSVGGPETRVVRDEVAGNADWKFKEGDQVGAMLVDRVKNGVNIPTSSTNPGGGLDGWNKKNGQSARWAYFEYVNGVTKKIGNADYIFTDTYKTAEATEKNDAREFYDITQEVWTNYPYNQVAGSTSSFQTEARLVEGNYIYYTPYNEAVQTRGPLMATLPVKQDVSTEFKAVEDFYAGNDPVLATITYLSAKAADTKVSAEMQPIFAYPKFTIINDFEGYLFDGNLGGKNNAYYLSTANEAKQYTMTVKKIEIYTGNNTKLFWKKGIYATYLDQAVRETKDPTKGWNKVGNNYETAKTSAILSSAGTYDQAYKFSEAENAYEFEGDIVKTTIEKKSNRIVLDFGDGVVLEPNSKPYSFHAVMPAEDYTEAGLYATILVEIEGKEYYILTNQAKDGSFDETLQIPGMVINKAMTDGVKSEWYDYAYFTKNGGITGVTDYQFVDRYNHASDNIVLVRGERFPVAEINADRTPKNFYGDLLKIDLVGGMSQIAVAKKKEVTPEPEPEPEAPKGILTTADLLNYLNDVHRDAHVEEVDEWDDDNATFNFLKEEEGFDVVINADVIAALENRLPDGSITLKTNLPIAAGVSVELVDDKTYEFSANGHKYKISYTLAFPSSSDVVNGINVGVTGNIKAKNNTVTGAVVFTTGPTSLTNPAGIVTINVANGTTLTVNATADVAAVILAEAATVEIVNGSKNLTNPNNKFDKVINSALVAFEGPAKTVEYSCFGWDIAPIAANTKVNYLKINPTKASGISSFEINNEAVKLVANLKDVTIELGSNITGLTSKSNVTLTNIKKLTAVNAEAMAKAAEEIVGDDEAKAAAYFTWNISGSNPVVVSNAKGIDANIKAGEGVTFKE